MLWKVLGKELIPLNWSHWSAWPHLLVHDPSDLVQLPKHIVDLSIIALCLLFLFTQEQISLLQLLPFLPQNLVVLFELLDDPLALLVKQRILVVLCLDVAVHILDFLVLHLHFMLPLFHVAHPHFYCDRFRHRLLQSKVQVLSHLIA